jgi:cell division protein FtsI/penicillin-binding protein 2
LAAHLLDFVGIDNKGLSGMSLRATRKFVAGRKDSRSHDARRRAFSASTPPTTGSTIELTIDEYLQHIAERELHAGVPESSGERTTIMDPHTGRFWRWRQPTFNPNE